MRDRAPRRVAIVDSEALDVANTTASARWQKSTLRGARDARARDARGRDARARAAPRPVPRPARPVPRARWPRTEGGNRAGTLTGSLTPIVKAAPGSRRIRWHSDEQPREGLQRSWDLFRA